MPSQGPVVSPLAEVREHNHPAHTDALPRALQLGQLRPVCYRLPLYGALVGPPQASKCHLGRLPKSVRPRMESQAYGEKGSMGLRPQPMNLSGVWRVEGGAGRRGPERGGHLSEVTQQDWSPGSPLFASFASFCLQSLPFRTSGGGERRAGCCSGPTASF